MAFHNYIKMYIKREIEHEVLTGASGFPVVTITGPRQSGKTTMIKHLFPDKKYVSLENPDNYEIAKKDQKDFFMLCRPTGDAIPESPANSLQEYLRET